MEKFNHIIHTLIALIGEMAPYILLGFLIAGVLHSFVSTRHLSRHLSGRGWKTVVKSALFGVPLPLCSCGVLPTAISLRRSGASRAATTSFLVATPQTGVDSIAATWSLLGPAFAVIRPVSAFATAIASGIAVGRNEEEDFKGKGTTENQGCEYEKASWMRKTTDALKYGFVDLIDSIGSWLVIGLIIAALITVFIPSDFFVSLAEYPLLAMLAVVAIAIPMYVCATGSIPIALSLMLKGLSPGTALVLLMAGPAANFASFTLISRELGRKAGVIYITSIVVCSILFGLMIDLLLPSDWFIPRMNSISHSHGMALTPFETICSVVLIALLGVSFFKRFIVNKLNRNKMENIDDVTVTYKITGMNCPHCQASVTKALSNVEGVSDVSVNLSTGMATVAGRHKSEDAMNNVRSAGFEIEPA